MQITFTDNATPAIQRLAVSLAPLRAHGAIGAAVATLARKTLIAANGRPNKLGGARTGYYLAAARRTSHTATAQAAVIHVGGNTPGIALHYYGGVVRPKTKRFLTIPARPEAHGKRWREFSRADHAAARKQGRPLFFFSKKAVIHSDQSILPSDSAIQSEITANVQALIASSKTK
jgi:phage gpG-like protein